MSSSDEVPLDKAYTFDADTLKVRATLDVLYVPSGWWQLTADDGTGPQTRLVQGPRFIHSPLRFTMTGEDRRAPARPPSAPASPTQED